MHIVWSFLFLDFIYFIFFQQFLEFHYLAQNPCWYFSSHHFLICKKNILKHFLTQPKYNLVSIAMRGRCWIYSIPLAHLSGDWLTGAQTFCYVYRIGSPLLPDGFLIWISISVTAISTVQLSPNFRSLKTFSILFRVQQNTSGKLTFNFV